MGNFVLLLNNQQNITNMATDNIDQNEEKKDNDGNHNANQPKINKETLEPQPPKEPQKITIELYKYKTLIDALEDRHKVKRVVITVFFLGILLFAGITVITLSIKRLYPYSDITTNGLGATTIKSEKNEVSYWLFNTAILWANSGITVDKGDIITIRTSGKSHTAIHHLYDAAKNNISKRNDWVGGEGEPDIAANESDYIRRRFRIFPDMPSGALLMQVVEKDNLIDNPDDGNPDNFYFIGKERQHIYINNSGTLYFTINDIVLNTHTIANMMWESIRRKYKKDISIRALVDGFLIEHNMPTDVFSVDKELHLVKNDPDEWKKNIKILFDEVFKNEVIETNVKYENLNQHFDLLIQELDSLQKLKLDSVKRDSILDSIQHLYRLALKDSYDSFEKIGDMKLGYSHQEKKNGTGDSLVCELSYYFVDDTIKNNRCKSVWFDDNIGSFLIVIEKTKSEKP